MFSVWWLFSSTPPATINCACFTWLTMQSVAKGRSLQTSTDQGKKLRQVVCSEARDWTIRQTPKAITGLQIKTHKGKITNSESSIHYSQPKFTNLTNFRKMLEKKYPPTNYLSFEKARRRKMQYCSKWISTRVICHSTHCHPHLSHFKHIIMFSVFSK